MAQTHTTDIHGAFDPALPPSPSLLFYLYADRIAAPARRGTKAPLTESHVKTDQLANALFGVACWRLYESGLASLEIVQERRFLNTTTHLRITRTTQPVSAQRDGIEGGILDILTPGALSAFSKRTLAWEALPKWLKQSAIFSEQGLANLASRRPDLPIAQRANSRTPPATVTEVITRWYGNAVSDPEHAPIRWTESEGVAKGYLMIEDAHRNPVAALFLGKTTIVPIREKIVALEPQFTELLGRWQAFRTHEATLADQLEREITAGIEDRRRVPDSGSTS